MYEGIVLATGEIVKADDEVWDLGRETADGDRPPQVACLTVRCRCPMWRVGEGTRRAHYAGHHTAQCRAPLAENPFEDLPVGDDAAERTAQGRLLKQVFRRNWRRHYAALDSRFGGMVPGLHVREFLRMLDIADDRRLFNLRGLRECDVPLLLAALLDYPPHLGIIDRDKKPAREFWYRFWFDPGEGGPDRLWIDPEQRMVLVRGRYSVCKDETAARRRIA